MSSVNSKALEIRRRSNVDEFFGHNYFREIDERQNPNKQLTKRELLIRQKIAAMAFVALGAGTAIGGIVNYLENNPTINLPTKTEYKENPQNYPNVTTHIVRNNETAYGIADSLTDGDPRPMAYAIDKADPGTLIVGEEIVIPLTDKNNPEK